MRGKAGTTSYTPEKGAEICGHLEQGVSWPDACALSDIWERQGWRWREQGNKDLSAHKQTDLAQFVRDITKARATFRKRQLEKISGKPSNTWTAAAWILERSDFENWGRKERREITGRDGQPLVIQSPDFEKPKRNGKNGNNAAENRLVKELER